MRAKITNCTIFFTRSNGTVQRRNNQNIEIGVPDDLWGYNGEKEFIKALCRGHNLTYRGHPFHVTPMSKIVCYRPEPEQKSIQQLRQEKLTSLGILLDNEKQY